MPVSNIVSPKFWTRAFAVYGHALAVGLLISIPLWVVYILLIAAVVSRARY